MGMKAIVKIILKSCLIFLGLFFFFLIVDSSLNISAKLDWFPVVAMLLPPICAVASLVSSFKKPNPGEGIHHKKKPADIPPPSPEPPRKKTILERIDEMEGAEFERFCAALLDDLGYQQIHVTKSTGDQGVDIIAIRGGLRWAFQCKRYASKLGNAAIQQVNTGKMMYSCQKAVVITNNYFTSGAVKAAKTVGVELWDRDVLSDKINRVASGRNKIHI